MEGTTDAFFRGFFDTKEEVQETDTHFRCQDGKPDFEYRLVYKIKTPRKNTKFSLQGYDFDLFSNELIGEAQIDLKELLNDSSLTKKPLTLNKRYYDEVMSKADKNMKLKFDDDDDNKFWVGLMSKNKAGKIESRGDVRVQIDVVPIDMAIKNPVGKARDNPNHSPYLPAPEGRIEFSMNPLKMFNQLVGPAVRRKLAMSLCCILCILITLPALPNIMANAVVKMIFG